MRSAVTGARVRALLEALSALSPFALRLSLSISPAQQRSPSTLVRGYGSARTLLCTGQEVHRLRGAQQLASPLRLYESAQLNRLLRVSPHMARPALRLSRVARDSVSDCASTETDTPAVSCPARAIHVASTARASHPERSPPQLLASARQIPTLARETDTTYERSCRTHSRLLDGDDSEVPCCPESRGV